MEAIVIITTVGSELEAENIARELVRKKLAACVQMISQINSVYMWKGKTEKEPEIRLEIKTRKDLFEAVRDEIVSIHSYELPEIISLRIDRGLEEYINWIASETC